MQEYLRVKVKSLAAEAKIIRDEERKAKAHRKFDLRLGLAEHRRGVVRHAARSSLLAYGFLRNTPYLSMEKNCRREPDWNAIEKMVMKYGLGDRRDIAQKFSEWKDQNARPDHPA